MTIKTKSPAGANQQGLKERRSRLYVPYTKFPLKRKEKPCRSDTPPDPVLSDEQFDLFYHLDLEAMSPVALEIERFKIMQTLTKVSKPAAWYFNRLEAVKKRIGV